MTSCRPAIRRQVEPEVPPNRLVEPAMQPQYRQQPFPDRMSKRRERMNQTRPYRPRGQIETGGRDDSRLHGEGITNYSLMLNSSEWDWESPI